MSGRKWGAEAEYAAELCASCGQGTGGSNHAGARHDECVRVNGVLVTVARGTDDARRRALWRSTICTALGLPPTTDVLPGGPLRIASRGRNVVRGTFTVRPRQ